MKPRSCSMVSTAAWSSLNVMSDFSRCTVYSRALDGLGGRIDLCDRRDLREVATPRAPEHLAELFELRTDDVRKQDVVFLGPDRHCGDLDASVRLDEIEEAARLPG